MLHLRVAKEKTVEQSIFQNNMVGRISKCSDYCGNNTKLQELHEPVNTASTRLLAVCLKNKRKRFQQ